ncbi:MAG: histidinol-phosphate transaminase [Lachnospiraceae bacterium]|jgi:histidinol-phosphate aminotransferase|nr:histidinol-phosphate transaminase [Lachnospiraceae bacterium]
MANWREHVRKVTPYVPGFQPKEAGVIKLNTNENPYPPAPGVCEALRGFDAGALRKYPDPTASVLVDALASYHGLPPDRVFVGVGSDDVLAMAFMTFFDGGAPILFPDVTYSFYPVWAGLFGIPYRTVPVGEGFVVRAGDYVGSGAGPADGNCRACGGIVLPNPNAPSGLALPASDIEKIAAGNPGCVVIIDEAYIDFGGETCLPLLGKYDNLLVVRTYSKSRSLAGLRIGYALGCADLIRAMNDVKFSYNSYTLNTPTILAGAKALEDEAYFCSTLQKIVETREAAKRELAGLGFSFPDSAANFIFATHDRVSAPEIYARLRDRGIYVRHFTSPGIDNHLRITVGTDGEMAALYGALEGILG